MKVKIKKFNPKATIPKQATEFAGGWDVTTTEIIKESDDLVTCMLGFGLELPEGYKLTLVPRSSLTKTKWVLQNSPGLGDMDFFGQYRFKFRAFPEDVKQVDFGTYGVPNFESKLKYPEFPYKVGDRIGQVYLEEVISMEFEEVDELGTSNRSSEGFGSTGK